MWSWEYKINNKTEFSLKILTNCQKSSCYAS